MTSPTRRRRALPGDQLVRSLALFATLVDTVPPRSWFGDDPERHEEVVRSSLRQSTLRLATVEQRQAAELARRLAEQRPEKRRRSTPLSDAEGRERHPAGVIAGPARTAATGRAPPFLRRLGVRDGGDVGVIGGPTRPLNRRLRADRRHPRPLCRRSARLLGLGALTALACRPRPPGTSARPRLPAVALSAPARSHLEARLVAPVIDLYGLRETGPVASEARTRTYRCCATAPATGQPSSAPAGRGGRPGRQR